MVNKFLNFSAGILALTFFYSCSSDNDEGNDQQGLEFAGTYALVEARVSQSIDLNFDGTTSNDLLAEGGCISENLVLNADFSWSSTLVNISVLSPITGNLYNLSCGSPVNLSGNWGVSNNNLFLVGDSNRTFVIQGQFLVEIIGNDLPGLSSLTYSRTD